MFLREKRIGAYTYVYLVETVREDGTTKQRIIQNLGRKEVVDVASETWLKLARRDLRKHQIIDSSGEVNRLVDELGCERLPSVDLAHVDLSASKQCPEQHCSRLD